MCGIYGQVSLRDKVNPQVLQTMGQALKHRGPDDEGEMILHQGGGSVGLGHKRLTIIDLSAAGRQPMPNEDETIWLTFNGEIYNYRELKKELEDKGHRFQSRTDAEVIVHLYEEMGTGCLEKLKGMFAFGLWDSDQKALFLARDRLGKKPLHYAFVDGGIVFASEIKALIKHPQLSKELDLMSLNKYLTFEYIPAPASIFQKVKKLEPGHYLLYRDGQAQSGKYWDIPLVDNPIGFKTEAEYLEQLREILDRAVRRRLVADVPVGVFLSGGIDSGMVAAVATRANQDLECFSIGFDDPSFDERKYATRVANALNVKHRLKMFSSQEMLESLHVLPDIMDEPLADASILPTYLLSKFTAESVKVALSGDGGDELFAGYPTYQAHRLVTYYDFLPGSVKAVLRGVASCLPVSHDNISTDFKIKQFLKGAGVSSEIRFFIWMGAFIDSEKKELLSDDLNAELRKHNTYEDIFAYINDSKLTKDLERILYLSMKLYLQDGVLVKVDRASMANSLEVRCPLLDHEFVEFVCGLPMLYKLNGLKTKYLLKKATQGILPRSVVYRQKKGFGIPISRWLMKELRELTLEYLSERRIRRQGFFDWGYVKRLMEDHMAKKRDNRKLLWTLLVFQIWHERFVENRL
ncbi:asparagine synthase (glutamine-hydrolyzing) [Candidatus Uhrbacteria bacterium]|nr:asparagine synthase (glutamine-hydrolyzing) [Candidatus Uhrbacteria bacterium]